MDSGGQDLAYIQTGGAVTIDGTFTTSNAGLQGGTLNGSGTIAGNLVADAGMLSPGSSPGTLTITNNFTQNAGNTLRIEVAARGAGQFTSCRSAARPRWADGSQCGCSTALRRCRAISFPS